MTRARLPLLVEHLETLRADLLEQLSAGQADALPLKIETDIALRLLETCERHGVLDPAQVSVIPPRRTQTPSSEYRLVEDHESDDPLAWQEVLVNGMPLRPTPHSVILEPRTWPGDDPT